MGQLYQQGSWHPKGCSMAFGKLPLAAVCLAAVACLVLQLAAPSARAAVLLAGPPLSLSSGIHATGRAAAVQARQVQLADRPGAKLPETILRNINGLWNKSISGRCGDSRVSC